MVCQEEVFEFFSKMSLDLNLDGYPILDDLKHEFPGIPSYEEILEDAMETKEIENMTKTEEE